MPGCRLSAGRRALDPCTVCDSVSLRKKEIMVCKDITGPARTHLEGSTENDGSQGAGSAVLATTWECLQGGKCHRQWTDATGSVLLSLPVCPSLPLFLTLCRKGGPGKVPEAVECAHRGPVMLCMG